MPSTPQIMQRTPKIGFRVPRVDQSISSSTKLKFKKMQLQGLKTDSKKKFKFMDYFPHVQLYSIWASKRRLLRSWAIIAIVTGRENDYNCTEDSHDDTVTVRIIMIAICAAKQREWEEIINSAREENIIMRTVMLPKEIFGVRRSLQSQTPNWGNNRHFEKKTDYVIRLN